MGYVGGWGTEPGPGSQDRTGPILYLEGRGRRSKTLVLPDRETVEHARASSLGASGTSSLGASGKSLLSRGPHPPIAPYSRVGDYLFSATCEPSIDQPALASPAHSAVKKCWRGDQARRDRVRIVSPRRRLAAPRRAGPLCRDRRWRVSRFHACALLTPQRSVLRPGHRRNRSAVPSRQAARAPTAAREIERCSGRRYGCGHSS